MGRSSHFHRTPGGASRDRSGVSEQGLLDMALAASTGPDRTFRNSDLFRAASEVEASDGTEARAALLRRALAALLRANVGRIGELSYPDSVLDLVRAEFDRIGRDIDQAPDERFDHQAHRTRSDFRIAAFSRIPAGVEHLETGGLPRSVIARGGFRQAVRVLALLRKTGGFGPFLDLHLRHGIKPAAFLLTYTREAQRQVYTHVAETLEMNPHYRGMMAASWWYDPALEQFSPHLSFLRRELTNHGAYLFRYGPSDNASRDALANSPTRQGLAQSGQFVPQTFIVVWPRDQVLQWAQLIRE